MSNNGTIRCDNNHYHGVPPAGKRVSGTVSPYSEKRSPLRCSDKRLLDRFAPVGSARVAKRAEA